MKKIVACIVMLLLAVMCTMLGFSTSAEKLIEQENSDEAHTTMLVYEYEELVESCYNYNEHIVAEYDDDYNDLNFPESTPNEKYIVEDTKTNTYFIDDTPHFPNKITQYIAENPQFI